MDDATRTLNFTEHLLVLKWNLTWKLVGFDSALVSLDRGLNKELDSVVGLAFVITSDIGYVVLDAVG